MMRSNIVAKQDHGACEIDQSQDRQKFLALVAVYYDWPSVPLEGPA